MLLKIFFRDNLFNINDNLCNIIIILMNLQTLGLLILLANNGDQQIEHIDKEY